MSNATLNSGLDIYGGIIMKAARIAAVSVIGLSSLALTSSVYAATAPPPPNVHINGGCGTELDFDITYPQAPEMGTNWNFTLTVSNGTVITYEDTDGDLMGAHVVLPLEDVPDGNYEATLDAQYGEFIYEDIATGTVVCGDGGVDPDRPTDPDTITPTVDPIPPVERPTNPDTLTPTIDPTTPETIDPVDPDTTDPDGNSNVDSNVDSNLDNIDEADPATPATSEPTYTG